MGEMVVVVHLLGWADQELWAEKPPPSATPSPNALQKVKLSLKNPDGSKDKGNQGCI